MGIGSSSLHISHKLRGNENIKSSLTAELVNSEEDLKFVELVTFCFAD